MTKSEIAEKIALGFINFIKEAGLFMGEVAFTPYGQLRIHKIPRTTYYHKLKQFEKQGIVKKSVRPRNTTYSLTPKGKQLLKIRAKRIPRKDGVGTLIIFDIPETKYHERNALRHYLLRNGYTQIQKSALISQFELSSELKELIDELELRSHVTVVLGKIDYYK